jgi:uncharacterized coiled-coil DUF342 family protein
MDNPPRTRKQCEARIEKLSSLITTKSDKRSQLVNELDQHKAERKELQEILKTLPADSETKGNGGKAKSGKSSKARKRTAAQSPLGQGQPSLPGTS